MVGWGWMNGFAPSMLGFISFTEKCRKGQLAAKGSCLRINFVPSDNFCAADKPGAIERQLRRF
jgi:hypothetical protein